MSNFVGTPGGGAKFRYGLVVSRFNSDITGGLRKGCLEALTEAGVTAPDIDTVEVPGAVELPLACQRLAESGRYGALLALGCVIRGETTHYDYVCQIASQGVLQVSLATGTPVIFGVLTTETRSQAEARVGDGYANKGYECGLAALEMASLMGQLSAVDE